MITSTANGKVKRLIVEGIRMFREVPVDELQEVYVSESFYKKEKVLVNAIAGQAGVHIEVLTDTVFAHASDTKTPQGVLCVVRQKSYKLEDLLKGEKRHLLVLDNLQDPGNMGTIVRTAEGAGVTGVIMSRDCVDIYNPKTIRSTMGSIYRMPFYYAEDILKAIRKIKDAGIKVYAAHLDGVKSYDEEDYAFSCAFLIGNEGNGLREETSKMADHYIIIPMSGEVESLNAAIAASVLMFEVKRQRRNTEKNS